MCRRFDVPPHGEALKFLPPSKILIKDTKAALLQRRSSCGRSIDPDLDHALLAAGFTV
jgi:hypothetical protein